MGGPTLWKHMMPCKPFLYLTPHTIWSLMQRYRVTIRALAARMAIPLARVRQRRTQGITCPIPPATGSMRSPVSIRGPSSGQSHHTQKEGPMPERLDALAAKYLTTHPTELPILKAAADDAQAVVAWCQRLAQWLAQQPTWIQEETHGAA